MENWSRAGFLQFGFCPLVPVQGNHVHEELVSEWKNMRGFTEP